MDSGYEASSTSNDEFETSRRYEILINRLGRFLKKNPQFSEDEDEDEDIPWCWCQQGDLGTVSVRCDAPDCRVRWYHKECLPFKDQQLVDEFDLWICPNCLMHQLVELIKEQRSIDATSDLDDDIDAAAKQEINMAIVDARLRESGRWIFKDPIENIARHQRSGDSRAQSEDQPYRPHQGQGLSLIAAGNATSAMPETPSRFEAPVPGTWGASASVKSKLSVSVSNFASLQASARIWTSEATQVVVSAEETLSVEYKHTNLIPSLEDDLSNCPRFLLRCTSVRAGNDTIEIALDLLVAFSLNLHHLFREFSMQPSPRRLLGTIHLTHIDMNVLTTALDFLKGECLSITLPSANNPLTTAQKLALIQYTHLAHILCIQPLQNAAMHALCTSILRRPQDWSDTWAIADLLNDTTFEGNPARRVLFDGPSCLLPEKKRKQLPCGVEERDIICMNRGVKAMWRPGGTMAIEHAENDDCMDDCMDEDIDEYIDEYIDYEDGDGDL